MGKCIGVLALQGDFPSHLDYLNRHYGEKINTIEVRNPDDLSDCDGLILPGGESTAMLKLISPNLESSLCAAIAGGMPTFATCAGLILLANEVSRPPQRSFGLLDVGVERNSYGRQVNSFIAKSLELTELGSIFFKITDRQPIEGVFIRAPKITHVSNHVEVLARFENCPVLVKQDNIVAASFHPELSESSAMHDWLVTSVKPQGIELQGNRWQDC